MTKQSSGKRVKANDQWKDSAGIEEVSMKRKVREWIKRYVPAEILSLAATLLAASITYKLTREQVATALAATWAGNIAYFGYILFIDVIKSRKKCLSSGKLYTSTDLLANVRFLIVEFGVAEIADSFFIRPALMYQVPIWMKDLLSGTLVAKIAADVIFYIPTIVSYELSKKHIGGYKR